ncbi:MAG: hypothetical protein CM15mP127_03850 [Gammaproteobacteria bacterium]|nr:MAG: hypothetical protein CM15mP127_03850 [Gammaproteobacteria bacterium]
MQLVEPQLDFQRAGKGYASGMSVGDATFFGRMAGISAAKNNY